MRRHTKCTRLSIDLIISRKEGKERVLSVLINIRWLWLEGHIKAVFVEFSLYLQMIVFRSLIQKHRVGEN